jgi:SagB-type dehydrogenase family enzyme
MILNFGKLFQQFSKDRFMRGLVNAGVEESLWPPSWKTIEYKTYDRFPKIKLPVPKIAISAEEMILSRQSVREWDTSPINLNQLSNLLYYSCGVIKKSEDKNLWKRAYGSAGGRYPVEVYLVNFVTGDLQEKVYHYNVAEHSLDVLWDYPSNLRNKLFTYDYTKNATLGFFFSIKTSRMEKYGERGYRAMYAEVGAISHTINLLSKSQGIGSVTLMGISDLDVERALDIDGEIETVVLGMVLGNKKNKL